MSPAETSSNTFTDQPGGKPRPLFACVAIVGVGMMGGSLGLALRARDVAGRIIGVDTSDCVLAQAQGIGAIDAGTTDLRAGIAEADCVLLAAPVSVIPALLEMLAPYARPDALISDIGSTKQRIVAAGERLLGTRFVGGHPMAGSPLSGIEASQPDLFADAPWGIVRSRVPDLHTDTQAVRLAEMAVALGARPVLLDSKQHDRLVALVSHLPHVLSFAFADAVAACGAPEQARSMAGSSYRDMMRVSHADRGFWNAIFRDNRAALLQALEAYETQLQTLKRMIEDSDIGSGKPVETAF